MNAGQTPDDDIQAAQAPGIVKMGGGAALGAGALALLICVQAATGFSLSTSATIGLAVVGVSGLASAVAGLALMRVRRGAAVAAIVCSAVLLLVTSAWLLFSVSGGLVSLFALSAPPISIAAVVLSAMSLAPATRVAEARARLAESGMDMGM